MDNKKRFPKIVLLFILILLAVLSLMISMMAGSSARRSGDGSELAENVTAGETQEESGRQQGEPTTKTDLEDIPGGIIDQTENVDEETPETAGTDEDVEEARRKREEDERYVQYRRELAGESRKKARSEAESCNPAPDGDPEEGPYIPPTILIVSDLHYISEAVHDGGEAFVNMMLRDDGKLSHCSDAILEAMIDEAIARKVSAVVMSGDNTYNGEREPRGTRPQAPAP